MNPKCMVSVCADEYILFLIFLTMENYSMARIIKLPFKNSDHMDLDLSSTSTIYLGQVT